jgi:hypothetical protein
MAAGHGTGPGARPKGLEVHGHLFPSLDRDIADRLDRIRASVVTASRSVPEPAEVSEG